MNDKAFGGDTFLQETYKQLVLKYKPDLLIETGTYEGDTTEYLASFGLPVVTTEINVMNYETSKQKLRGIENITFLLGDSEKSLIRVFDTIKDKKIIAFLDAHWLNDKTLERELYLLSNLTHPPVILVHDFFVPDKPFGFDRWDNHRYDYVYFKRFFDVTYKDDTKYTFRYNEEANGQQRGVIILEPRE